MCGGKDPNLAVSGLLVPDIQIPIFIRFFAAPSQYINLREVMLIANNASGDVMTESGANKPVLMAAKLTDDPTQKW